MNLNLNLNLNKPIAFIKVATTGLQALKEKGVEGDRIIEISITKINTDRTVKTGTRLVNPERPIPAQATAINGITDEMVAGMPAFKDIAAALNSFIGDSDLAGFSISNFDIKFLIEEFGRAEIPFTTIGRKIVDISSIYNQMEKRDYRAAASKFAGQELADGPISSETTNNISISILNGIVDSYNYDERFQNPNPVTLHENFSKNNFSLDVHRYLVLNSDGRPVFGLGKYKGKLIAEVLSIDAPYLDWCINVSDFPADAKYFLRGIIEKIKSVQVQPEANQNNQ